MSSSTALFFIAITETSTQFSIVCITFLFLQFRKKMTIIFIASPKISTLQFVCYMFVPNFAACFSP